VTGATTLAIDNGVGDVTGATSRVVSPTATTTYTLTATGTGGGPVTATVTVTVGSGPIVSGFTNTGSMSVGRRYHTATLLRDGRVLVVGGSNGTVPLRTAELYDPASGTFVTTVGSMSTARQNHSAALLSDGRVLVAGGVVDSAGTTTATAEVFDPVSGTFTSTLNNMAESRSDFTARTLPGGTVLVAGGFVRFPSALYLSSAAIYDPSTNRFTATGSLTVPRAGPLSVLLPGGTVLVTGGKNGAVYLASAETYDPASRVFTTAASSMGSGRVADTVTMLQVAGSPPAAAGKVLFAGGFGQGYLNTADLYDPGPGTFSATPSMGTHRGYHTAALLPNGQVLIAGGTDGVTVLKTAEFFDPVLGSFVPATGLDMNSTRWTHTATELQDGRVLVVGGADSRSVTLATAEIWTTGP
jgi:WD40 repeat protein